MANASVTGSPVDVTSSWYHVYTKKQLLIFSPFSHTSVMDQMLFGSAVYAIANIQTGLLSFLTSKEANIRLSRHSWAQFHRKCKHCNSNIMTSSTYKDGNTVSDSIQKILSPETPVKSYGNVIFPWIRWPGLFPVPRAADNSVSEPHIQVGPVTSAAAKWSWPWCEWGKHLS